MIISITLAINLSWFYWRKWWQPWRHGNATFELSIVNCQLPIVNFKFPIASDHVWVVMIAVDDADNVCTRVASKRCTFTRMPCHHGLQLPANYRPPVCFRQQKQFAYRISCTCFRIHLHRPPETSTVIHCWSSKSIRHITSYVSRNTFQLTTALI